MKNTRTAAIILLLFTALGCSKQLDNKPGVPSNDTAQKYAVNLDASGFEAVTGDFNGRRNARSAALDSSQSAINHIYYYVFQTATSSGLYRSQHHVVTDSSFKSFHDSLPTGEYRIMIVASHDTLNYGQFSSGGTVVPMPGGDLFVRSYLLNVSGNVSQTVVLERAVTKFRLLVFDPLPSNVGRVALNFNRSNGNATNILNFDGSILQNVLGPTTGFFTVKEGERGKPNFTRDFYVLSTDTATFRFVNVIVQDLQQQQIVFRQVKNVSAPRNKMVTLRGILFNGFPSDSGLSVQFPIDTTFQNGGTLDL